MRAGKAYATLHGCAGSNETCDKYHKSYVVAEMGTVARKRNFRGGSRVSGKEVICIKVWGIRFADFLSYFLNIP